MLSDSELLEEYTTILDVWAPGAIVGGVGYQNQETNMLASTITPTPAASWLTAVDTLITTLKNASIWQTLDLFYCFAAPSANACTYNWLNTSVGTLTANGTINYGANKYAAGDGSTGYFSSSFSINSGKASNGNAEFGYFVLNECSTDAVSVFNSTGGKSSMALQGDGTGATIPNLSVSLNTSTAAAFSSQWGSTVGHWVIQQGTATQLQLFIDGTSFGVSSQTNAADSGTVQLFKSSAGAFTSRQTSFVHYGSSLTSAQQLTLSKALYTFLTTMTVKPMAGYLGLSTGPTNIAPYKHCSTGTGNSLYMPVTPELPSGEFQGRAGAYPYAAIIVRDPNYNSLVRLETHPGDYAPYDVSTNITRSQFNTESSMAVPWQTTCDLAFSFFIEVGSQYDSNDFNDLLDFHDTYSGVNCGPTHAIDAGSGKYYVWGLWNETQYINQPINSGGSTGSLTPLTYGVWHHVRTNWRLDNANAGFCNSWLDGVQVLSYPVNSSFGFGNPAGAPFWQQVSLYRGETPGGSPNMAIWYANIEFDDSSTSPFASRITNPLPVPPLQ